MAKNLSKIEKCKQLPKIETLEDCRAFYKVFFKYKLFDANYGAKDHKDYRDKPFEELSLDEVLTSFTIIQREDHWESFYESVFVKYIENKTFEKLYDRLQEIIKDDENNIHIVSLYFSEYGYGWPEEVYEYKLKNNKGKIKYNFYAGKESPKVNIKDTAKFSSKILNITKTWKRKYYWKEITICDGTMWELKIKLSNGKYIKSEGHQKFPENYNKLTGYLNRYVGKYRKGFIKSYSAQF